MIPQKIILILIDSLRADHLGCYGYRRNTSPFIDALAKESLLFERAFSTISYTCPSFASIFTSLYPSKHSIGFHQKFPKLDKDRDILLPEIMKSLGYLTAAFIGAVVLRKDTGLNSGFDYYDSDLPSGLRCAEEVNGSFLKWLDNNYKNDFFVMLHYYDVHLPYNPPKRYKEEFINDSYYGIPKYIDVVSDGWGGEGEIPQIGGIPKSAVLHNNDMVERDVRFYIAQYDGCIRYMDSTIGFLLHGLKELGIYDDCLIIITADHGEAMGENNVWFYHSLTVTPDQIYVPLIVKPHKDWCIEPKTIKMHVSLVDLFPTICDLVGFDHYKLKIDGKSLIRLIEAQEDKKLEGRTIISEIEGQIAYVDKDKIIIEPKKVDREKLVFFYVDELCDKKYIYSTQTLQEIFPMKFTGERYIPDLEIPEISYEHWHRYLYATPFVKDKVILDIACGEGYGSHLLSQYAKRVVGIDISPEVIEYASINYVKDNLEFKTGSAGSIPIEGKEVFDVIISFETIEHITEDEQKAFMREVKGLLKPDGLFIVSTPNKLIYSDIPNLKNEFHIKEFYINEFKDFLSSHFSNIKLMGQKVYPVSYIWDIDSKENRLTEYRIGYSENGFRPSEEPKSILYIMAACSNKEIEDINSSILVDLNEKLLKLRDLHIGNLEAILNNIYNSHGWRLLLKYYRLRDLLLPIGTRRRRIVKFAWNTIKSLKVKNSTK